MRFLLANVQYKLEKIMESERMLKCVLVGDGKIGKTSLIYIFITGTFPSLTDLCHIPYQVDDFAVRLKVDEKNIVVCLWDTHSEDPLRILTYTGADVMLLCFSIAIDKCNNETAIYESLESKWKPELQRYAKNVPIILVGLKEDLRHQENMAAITVKQGQKLAEKIGAAKYVECSAKHERGHNNVFEEACRTAFVNDNPTHDKQKRSKCCTIL